LVVWIVLILVTHWDVEGAWRKWVRESLFTAHTVDYGRSGSVEYE